MCKNIIKWSLLLLFVSYASTSPLSLLQTDHPPLAAGLSSRMAAHSPRIEGKADSRLPVPTPQDIEAIKKVAQVLIMLGGQVIPSIIGEPPVGIPTPPGEVPHDSVSDN